MITKGEILSINYFENTCAIRLPIFETSGSPVTISKAIIAIQPGVFNGYQPGDIVEVGFEDNRLEKAVILGKLYLGAEAESKITRGSLQGNNLQISSTASIPLETTLIATSPANLVKNTSTTTNYKSILDMVKDLSTLKTTIANYSESPKNFSTVYCKDLVTNLCGYKIENFSVKQYDSDDFYTLTYNDSAKLNTDQVKLYTKYMTGKAFIPDKFVYTTYSGCFVDIAGNLYCPCWLPDDEKNFRFYKVQQI